MVLPLALALMIATPQACPSAPATLPAGLNGWRVTERAPTIGKAFIVRGQDPARVRGLSTSDVARGGAAALVPIQIDRDGTYRIALSDGAWVDVTAGTRTLDAISHSHGPACSGIHKIVDFRLQRGRYALHLSGMKAPSVRVMIVQG
jgi:hypothetical protein